jgi:phosphohistidine phosphatase SixA
VNSRLRAATWVAHTKHDYARVLTQRGRRADQASARALRSDALATARSLGLDALARAIESGRDVR